MGRGIAVLALASGACLLQAPALPGQLFIGGAKVRARPARQGVDLGVAGRARPDSGRASKHSEGSKRHLRRLASLAAAAAAAVAVRPASVRAMPWRQLVNDYEPDHPPIRCTSSDADIALAKHLASVGATCYTTFWDRESQDQRENFGAEATKVAPFLECGTEGKRRQKIECREAGIKEYPTWVINGKRLVGAQKLADLAELSGFTEFPKDAFKSRGIRLTNYIW
eukprot:CAMPEP_0175483244 /NCGR_PEP_ID=MMETSP0095-20121207/79388_1 /TAXON_ID=311494 /ORGANISM="Alexandrium monilatum, Strain CCMP3105" /LENGTH=224 /DNA_ID=CAMNT_0016784947 /DNA_START=59 /DNA_END=731 /DNA_ORIENTATION=-